MPVPPLTSGLEPGERLLKLFRTLAGPGRLQLLELLIDHDITLEAGTANEYLSAELADLIACGCVTEDQVGRVHRYRADPRAGEVVNLVRAFAMDRSFSLNTCARIEDESRPGEAGRPRDDHGRGRGTPGGRP